MTVLFSPLKNTLQSFVTHDAQSQFSDIDKLSDHQYNIELKGVNTADINLKELKGKKIFLSYWGTWCPICVEEMPSIQAFYQNKKQDISFVMIYMKDSREKVLEYLQKNNYNFPVYEAVSPIETSLLPKEFPTSFLIDRQGNVKQKVVGYKDWSNFNF